MRIVNPLSIYGKQLKLDPGCLRMSPHPEVWAAMRAEIHHLKALGQALSPSMMAAKFGVALSPSAAPGFNDGRFYDLGQGPPNGGSARAPARQHPQPPTTGSKRALVLLVDFDDVPGPLPANYYRDLLFAQAAKPSGPSLREFFDLASNHRLDVNGDVVGWLRMPRPLNDYVDNQSGTGKYPKNSQRLADDAISEALKQGVKMSNYDADGDGWVDGLVIVHSTPAAESTRNLAERNQRLWSHKWNLRSAQKHDGVLLYSYTIQPFDGPVGVFCHEFGHFLGLPDLYDTSNLSEGVGDWCLMGSGAWGGQYKGTQPVDFCAWAKLQLGWIQPTLLKGTAQPLVAKIGDVARVNHKQAGPEYFLLEARSRVGLDAALPGDGLLIWHIDDHMPDNATPSRYKVGLEQADGNEDLQNLTNRGDDGDTFPGTTMNSRFDDTSVPNTRTNHQNRQSGVDIHGIAWTNGVATGTITAP